ncbi:hypothetical protein [Nocardiopsis aegyptia]|uniref:Uncharacterized protein n=1 Tax=Nocardiopsis aegyptia TaxID=220378 RepID=A0A7Z0ETH1_9ACTN|nr:hypothetical protein [Nocardiopsis aegyptia]NYJ37957.1 hypothetical protein [Nocardiopsis aegyptia]
MATTLDPRRHPAPTDTRPAEREPVVLSDALGDVMTALTAVDPDLALVQGGDSAPAPQPGSTPSG